MAKLVIEENKTQSAFYIVKHEPCTEIETYFGGFICEVESVGTEDEGFTYEIEKWVEKPDDAKGFNTLAEAKDYLASLSDKTMGSCAIGLFGKSDVKDVMGSHWFPLKWFSEFNS